MLTSPSYRRVCRFAVNCAEHRLTENNTNAAARVNSQSDGTLRCIFGAIFPTPSFAITLALLMVIHVSKYLTTDTLDQTIHFS